MEIKLSSRDEEYVKELLAKSDFDSPEALFAYALHLLRSESIDDISPELQADLAEAIKESDSNDLLDGKLVLRELRKKYSGRDEKSA